ncbi:MAG TPA: ROK family protein [Pyrinomonadaceae bacterium]|nr:ROK family protein [Pyrinomonadaceae bacterium]
MPILGIDIGGTRLKVGMVNAGGKLLTSQSTQTPTSLETFKATLSDMAQAVSRDSRPESIGIGCKGVIDAQTATVVRQPGTFQFLEGLCFQDLLKPLSSAEVPVIADNDARVALAGEVVWGAARGKNNVVMLTLGTGVGGAVLADGRMLRGATGGAGLLGHITLVENGRFCDCGNRGCLETVFSARAIQAEALHAVYRGVESLLTDRFKDDYDALSCKAVFDAAAEGDTIAQAITGDAIRSLGAAAAGLLHVFDPELLILGGQIIEAGDPLLNPLREEVAWRSKRFLGRVVPIVTAEVGDAAGVIGAAALTLMK